MNEIQASGTEVFCPTHGERGNKRNCIMLFEKELWRLQSKETLNDLKKRH